MQIVQNDTKNQLTFRNIPDNAVIEIYNIDGKIMKRLSSAGREINLDITFLKRGLYMIRSYSSDYYLSELLVKE
ncbi:MAG: T9SS type A sorting domain-containing protein [Bacteroidales bacterium]|nr:T9SS type A sorting domain-containing protein [Bacteroidales bacterium]